jgi:hypothetical protein
MKTYSAIWTLLALASLLLITACQPINPDAQTQSTHTATIPTLPIVEPTHLAPLTQTSASQDGNPSVEPTHLVPPTQTSAPQDGNPSGELQTVLQPQGPVTVQNMLVLNSDPFGNILQMEFVNTGDQDLNISIPCGQVFEPSGESQEQALMVIQNTEFRLPAGETQTVSPYLACVNSDKSIPSQGASYQIGTMVDGNLLSLAECICSREMVNEGDDFNNLTLQFAVWMVADGVSFKDMLAQSGNSGALNQFTGGETGQAVSAFTDTIAVPAMDVIRSCDIAIP